MQRRLPEGTLLDTLDEALEQRLVERAEALIKSTNPRRCRQIAGLLTEFRDAGGHPTLYEYYKRAVQEALLDALHER